MMDCVHTTTRIYYFNRGAALRQSLLRQQSRISLDELKTHYDLRGEILMQKTLGALAQRAA